MNNERSFVNILSLTTFVNFIENVMNLRNTYNASSEWNRIPLSINIMYWPPHLQCTLLDKELRIEIANTIENSCKAWLKYYSPEKHASKSMIKYNVFAIICAQQKHQLNIDKILFGTYTLMIKEEIKILQKHFQNL